MATSEERMRVLKMIQEGKISAEEGLKLLETLEEAAKPVGGRGAGSQTPPPGGPKWIHIRVTDTNSNKSRVNIRLPVSLLNTGAKMGARFSPEVEGLDMNQLMQLIKSGEMGQVVDLYDDEDGEHVEVFLE